MPTFSAPQQFLIHHWTDARLLEDAMEAVRVKYEMTLDEVLEQVRKNHRELDCSKKYIRPTDGLVAIGKDKWPKGSYAWPSGFYIQGIQLEYLASTEQEHPCKYIWFADPHIDQEDAAERLRNAARNDKEHAHLEWEGDRSGWSLSCPLEQPKEKLLKLLVKDDARGFIH